jgi:hypothetical protein
MRITLIPVLAFAVIGCGQPQQAPKPEGHTHGPGEKADHAHGGDGHGAHKSALGTLEVQTRDGLKAGALAKLRLTIPGAKGVPIRDFALRYDAKVHLILIRHGLDQFAHLHPSVDPATGVLSAEYTFPTGGIYHLFADYQEPGQSAKTATARVEVEGDAPPAPGLTPDVPGLLKSDGIAAKVSVSGAEAGAEATVRFEVVEGEKPVLDLEPYMGAMGHLVVVSADAKTYVHAHPAEGQAGAKNAVAFGATFPQAGLYKGWGQFKRGGQVRVIPFVVRVE